MLEIVCSEDDLAFNSSWLIRSCAQRLVGSAGKANERREGETGSCVLRFTFFPWPQHASMLFARLFAQLPACTAAEMRSPEQICRAARTRAAPWLSKMTADLDLFGPSVSPVPMHGHACTAPPDGFYEHRMQTLEFGGTGRGNKFQSAFTRLGKVRINYWNLVALAICWKLKGKFQEWSTLYICV